MDKQVWRTTDPTVFKSSDVEGVGLLRVYQSKIYRWAKNNTGGALTAGRVYYGGLGNTAPFLTEAYTFGQASKGTAANLILGIAMAAVPDQSYGWFLCSGIYSGAGVEGTAAVAASDNLKGVTGQTYLVKDVAAGTAPTLGVKIIALAAQGSAGVTATDVYIDVL
jgi:hypothetical protein